MANTYLKDLENKSSSSIFNVDHFGMNIVSHRNDMSADSSFRIAMDSLSPNSIRYPGGTVTEDYFDPNSNFFQQIFENRTDDTITYTNGDEVATVSSVMNSVAAEGKAVDFVLPSEHLLENGPDGNRILDEAAISNLMEKIDGLLDGDYGDAQIAKFEIGNEYFVGYRLTPTEYGMVANRIAIELGNAYDRYVARNPLDHDWVEPEITVQAGAGWREGDNQTIINSLSTEAREEIDIVVGHYYPRTLDAVDNFDRFFSNLHEWQESLGLEETRIWLSEWNIQNSIGADRGIYQASSFIAAFHEMGMQGVDAANVWGVQFRNVDSSLLRLEDGPPQVDGSRTAVTDLTATGYIFQQMRMDLLGLQSLDLNRDMFVLTQDPSDIDVQSFGNANRAVIYISSRSGTSETITLNLDSYFDGNQHISATRVSTIDDPRTIYVNESTPNSHDAHIAVHSVSETNLIADDGVITLQPGEIIQIEVSYLPSGVILDGYQPLDPVPGDNYSDNFVGSQFDDRIRGFEGDDTLHGEGGSDILFGGAGNDKIIGGSGDDLINGEQGRDWLHGGKGNDRLIGGSGTDMIDGGIGGDRIFGGAEADLLIGYRDNDVLWGEDGNDTMFGGDDADLLFGGDGTDRIDGGRGNDLIFGGADSDLLIGYHGNDVLWGHTGNDRIFGGDGFDILLGNYGDDQLFGSNGNDRLDGGMGNDLLIGGGGDDVFIFSGHRDIIVDFQDDVDTIAIRSYLGGGELSVAGVLAMGEVENGTAVFDFGNNHILTINGVDDLSVLVNDFLII